MATYEKNGQLTYVDENGNEYVLFPKTQIECVEGLETQLESKRPNTWTPTAEDVGATPASHATNKSNPHGVTAAQVGARPNTWMPTADDVGAMPIFKKSLSNCSENDIVEPGGYYVTGTNCTNVTDGAPQIASRARFLIVMNADSEGTRVVQFESRTNAISSDFGGELFYRVIINDPNSKQIGTWRRIGDSNDLNWIRATEVSSNEYVSSTIEYLKSFYSTLEARKIYLISRFNGGTITFLIGQRASDQYGVFLEVSYTGGLYMYRLSNGTWSEKCVSS